VTNDRRLRAGELLLLDAGCEYDFYASDITRTFPLGARFSSCQRDLYEIVLAAQLAAIESVRPGVTLEEVHEAAVNKLVEGLRALGLLSGSTDEIISAGAYKRFYMHRTSHWLGMDVHDVGDYRRDGKSRQLEPGMVLTVEPGLYVSPAEESVPVAEMRATGIRIEDDVLVTAQGHQVLTASVPKKVDEIEALVAS
jgi:Xaa-Pro aminopeptidase